MSSQQVLAVASHSMQMGLPACYCTATTGRGWGALIKPDISSAHLHFISFHSLIHELLHQFFLFFHFFFICLPSISVFVCQLSPLFFSALLTLTFSIIGTDRAPLLFKYFIKLFFMDPFWALNDPVGVQRWTLTMQFSDNWTTYNCSQQNS